MKCVICKHGETKVGIATLILERQKATLVFKGVPAQICEVCGEQYVDETTTGQLLRTADEAAQAGVQVDVREYKAA